MLVFLLALLELSLNLRQLSQSNFVYLFSIIGNSNLVKCKEGIFGTEVGNDIKWCFLTIKDKDQKDNGQDRNEYDEICLPVF